MNSKILLSIFLLIVLKVSAQKIEVLPASSKISFRGLCVVDDIVSWASGSNGTVVRSTNGGRKFEWLKIKGFEKRDFRDIVAFDRNTAIIMAVDEPAVILKTKDGGHTWKEVFLDSTKGMFLDAMEFSGKNGVVIGDPINGRIFMAYSHDFGDSWQISHMTNDIAIQIGEAFFAASGTNIKLWHDSVPVFVSGGKRSTLYFSYGPDYRLPLVQGGQTTGANSLALSPSGPFKACVVGGDFAKDTISKDNCAIITLNPYVYHQPQSPPHGYRSCVEYITDKELITCGTSGVDISKDGGENWQLISTQSFNVCKKAKNGHMVFLAGANGRIAKLIW